MKTKSIEIILLTYAFLGIVFIGAVALSYSADRQLVYSTCDKASKEINRASEQACANVQDSTGIEYK